MNIWKSIKQYKYIRHIIFALITLPFLFASFILLFNADKGWDLLLIIFISDILLIPARLKFVYEPQIYSIKSFFNFRIYLPGVIIEFYKNKAPNPIEEVNNYRKFNKYRIFNECGFIFFWVLKVIEFFLVQILRIVQKFNKKHKKLPPFKYPFYMDIRMCSGNANGIYRDSYRWMDEYLWHDIDDLLVRNK